MKSIKKVLVRPLYGLSALALTAGVVLTGIVPGIADAASGGQVQTRSIQMSDSRRGATNVSYQVTFTPITTGAQSLVLDFCGDSSIIGSSCDTTAANVPGFTSVGFTGTGAFANWSMTHTGATVKLAKNTGTALGTSAVSFTLTGVANPNQAADGSFYARLYTYADTTYGGYTGPLSANLGTVVDYGGFALSTVAAVNVTATVMEQITFCAATTIAGKNCTSLGTAPNVILGSGSPAVLESTAVDTAAIHTQISTNASQGAVVNLKDTSSSTCAGLSRDNGSTCGIPAIGAFAAMQNGTTSGTASFGLNVANGVAGTYGGLVGSAPANANYGTTAGSYGMGTAVYGTYGDAIFNTNNTVCANVDNTLTFGATAAPTTPAGVYTATYSLIATGKY